MAGAVADPADTRRGCADQAGVPTPRAAGRKITLTVRDGLAYSDRGSAGNTQPAPTVEEAMAAREQSRASGGHPSTRRGGAQR
ncbi:hypothetical protein FRAHR75_60153 [Frankia sp. Hr75.2]|nr:hypothetical protein FRAHR75_60153 [Frankia sp. Hr75.2]